MQFYMGFVFQTLSESAIENSKLTIFDMQLISLEQQNQDYHGLFSKSIACLLTQALFILFVFNMICLIRQRVCNLI